MSRRYSRAERAKKKAHRLDHCGPTGKVRHRSEGAAVATLKQLKRQRTTDPQRGERRAYKCWGCGGWHLTKQEYGAPRGDVSRELPPPERTEDQATA
jgi:hypothetical protein